MLYRQGIIGNWWWQYRVPGRGDLNWGTVVGALVESGYDYVLCVENEDRGCRDWRGSPTGVGIFGSFCRRGACAMNRLAGSGGLGAVTSG